MIYLSAFADEISPVLSEQLSTLASEGLHFLDLRGAWGTNVLDFTDRQVVEIKQALDAQGTGVSAIASPIGKVAIDTPFADTLARFERALELARLFQTSFIRIFSFYPPESPESERAPAAWRGEVLLRLRELTARARAAGVVLLHENEKAIYGDTLARCLDLLTGIDDPHFQAAFDPANFIQCDQIPYPDAYVALRPWLRYVHVKDALADGSVVVAGEGLTNWFELLKHLRADGYTGFLSLEPHLAASSQFQGFSGPELFCRASRSLQGLLQDVDWEYR